MLETLRQLDHRIIVFFRKYGHLFHRLSLGVLFIWFGLLKPLGHDTTTSILAHIVFWGKPQTMVPILGLWEVAIGLCLTFRRLVRVAIFLIVIRIPGILLAFWFKQDICFYRFPFAPTPEGQYLIKDLVIFFAALAIAGALHERSTPQQRH